MIEDDAVCRLFCVDVLTAAGLRVYSATGGRNGLKLARKLKPAVIVLDRHLHDMPADEFLRLLAKTWREAEATCGLVGISADSSFASGPSADQGPVATWLQKPFPGERLVWAVNRLLDQPRLMPVRAVRSSHHSGRATGICEPVSPGMKVRFRNDLARQLEDMDQAIARLDWGKARFLAHRLSGAAALAGFGEFSNCCRQFIAQIENNAGHPDLADRYLELLSLAAGTEQEPLP